MDIQLLTLDRLPLPSLEVYAVLSFFAASCSLYYIWTESQLLYVEHNLYHTHSNFTTDFGTPFSVGSGQEDNDFWLDKRDERELSLRKSVNSPVSIRINVTGYSKFFTWHSAVDWAIQQPHCVWPLANLGYCLLILLSHFVQKTVFGSLRASEQENMKDQFWNLVFYKVVFIFGVVNVQEVEDAVGWCFFVSVIGFLQLARQLSKERHSYLILMNDWSRGSENRRRRILGLLCFIFLTSVGLFLGVCGWYAGSEREGSNREQESEESESQPQNTSYNFSLGIHNAIFMISEISLLAIQTLHALSICVFEHFKYNYQRNKEIYVPHPRNKNGEDQSHSIAHSINFYFDIAALLFDLVHHVHMLVSCNLFLSMTSLMVSLQMRARARQIHAILKKRQSFMWLTKHIAKYPDFYPNVEESENCAICWEPISSQKPKLLPCNHIFHTSCLKKWLLVSMNCPTCRFSLLSETESEKKIERMGQSFRVSRPPPYDPTPDGFWGFLQTGQTLLDLFGGWDPQVDEINSQTTTLPRSVSLFGDFVIQDWTVESAEVNRSQTPRVETHKQDTTGQDGSDMILS